MIAINNIVDVDFKVLASKSTIGTYKTAVYIIPYNIVLTENNKIVDTLLCTNTATTSTYNFKNSTGSDFTEIVNTNITQFFLNGGSQLLLVSATTDYTLDGFKKLIDKARDVESDFIYVILSNELWGDTKYSTDTLVEISAWIESLTAPDTIRLLLTKNLKDSDAFDFTEINKNVTSKFANYSVGIKHCSKENNGVLVDAALLIGAYFTQVNLNGSETIKDYCYTAETLSLLDTTVTASEEVTQQDYSKLMAGNYNFIDSIGTNIINFGGNLMNGVSLSIDFATICVENDICSATLSEMVGKLYLNQAGLVSLVAKINSQLTRYQGNGYIKTNSSYSGESLYIRYNGKDYTVVETNEWLINGYKIFAVPVSDISVEDRTNKQFPPIYVIIESLAGARTVKISGIVR